MRAQPLKASAKADLDKFWLRKFIRTHSNIGEIERHDEPIALGELSTVIEASPKATHFTRVGPERFELVAAVSGSRKRLLAGAVPGSRKRLAAALGAGERKIAHEFMRGMGEPQPVLEVPSDQAPVHQV